MKKIKIRTVWMLSQYLAMYGCLMLGLGGGILGTYMKDGWNRPTGWILLIGGPILMIADIVLIRKSGFRKWLQKHGEETPDSAT